MTTLRERVFWLVDRIRHNGVMAREVRALEDRDTHGIGEAQRDRELRDLLDYAVATVPYYKTKNSGTELEGFPVMDKAGVRGAGDMMLSPVALAGGTHIASTSGSTGTPFRVHHDAAKRRRVAAEAVYWGRRAGYGIGVPLYYLKVWSGRNRLGPIVQVARNIKPVDIVEHDATEVAALLQSLASRRRRSSVVSYGAVLESAARVLATRGPAVATERTSLVSIVSQSEFFSEEGREVVNTHLGVTPMARYGLEELGIVAQQVPGSGEWYRITPSSLVVEILSQATDDPADPGEMGRIVITDLVNRAQPLIRYDTGDLGCFPVVDGVEDRRWLAKIQGRRADQLFDSLDRPLPTLLMYRIWWKYPTILQYQVVQHERATYELRINVEEARFPEQELIDDFRELVGSDAHVRVSLTDEEFVFASGKRKALVSHYQPHSKSQKRQE